MKAFYSLSHRPLGFMLSVYWQQIEKKEKHSSHWSSIDRVETAQNVLSCFCTKNGLSNSVPLLFTIMTYLTLYGNTYNMTICHWNSIFCDCKLFLS